MTKCNWKLTGATTASDGYTCQTCGARREVHPDDKPERLGCAMKTDTPSAPAVDDLCADCGRPVYAHQMSYRTTAFAGDNRIFHAECGDPFGLKTKDAEITLLRAELAEAMRKSRGFCEVHDADGDTCPCCGAVHENDLRKQAERELAEAKREVQAWFEQSQKQCDLRMQAEAARDRFAAVIAYDWIDNRNAGPPPNYRQDAMEAIARHRAAKGGE